MDDLSGILEKLRISLAGDESPDADGSHPPVQNIIDAAVLALKKANENIPNKIEEILPFLKTHLETNNPNIMKSLLEFIAEVSKSENLREECINAGLIPGALNCLEKEDSSVTLQALRAIGNISCDNNKARDQILEVGGIEKIVNKLKELCGSDRIINGDDKLCRIVCGAILNVSLDNEALQKKAISLEAIPVLLGIIEHNLDKMDLCLMATNAVSCFLDLDEGLSSFMNSRGCQIFTNGLKTTSGESSIVFGECLMTLSEHDNIKQAMVKQQCVDILHEIIASNTTNTGNDDVAKKLQVAVDIVILLLADDCCLDLLFANGNNALVDKILSWNNSPVQYVRNSSPVAIGNIARTEANCVRLVKMETHKNLLYLLQNPTGSSNKDEIQLHVAVLMALKNFAIPVNNKPVLIASGALDCTLKFLCSPETPSPLAFRAISVTRLLVQEQATAVDTVCSKEQCISSLVSLAETSIIEALQSEASRLLATLLKNARTSDSILTIVENNGLLPVVAMIVSSHSVMQNEALVGIALAVNVIHNDLVEKMNENNLLLNINNVLGATNPDPQTCYNSMAVVEALFVKGIVGKNKLEDSGIMQNLDKLTSHSHQSVGQQATSVINKIKNP